MLRGMRSAHLAIAIAAAAAMAGCKRGHEAPPAGPDDSGWHVEDIPECAFQVELPGPVERSDLDFGGGKHSVVYRTPPDAPEMYIIECVVLPTSLRSSPGDVLRYQLANHRSPTELGAIGVPITGSGVADAPDGGTYWLAFENGVRIEGAVHVRDNHVADVSGSLREATPASRAALDRILGSYRAR